MTATSDTNFTVDNNTNPDLPSKAIHINFENIKSGDYIQIFGGTYFLSNKNGTQYNSGVASTSKTLTLTFRTQTIATDSTDANGKVTTTYDTYFWWESNWDVDWDSGSGTGHSTARLESYSEVTYVPPQENLTGIQLNATADSIQIGGSTTITAQGIGATLGADDVTWSVSPSANVTAVANGASYTLTGKSAGTVTVTATSGTVKQTYTVTIDAPTLTLTNNSSGLTAGDTGTMTLTVDNVASTSGLQVTFAGTGSVKVHSDSGQLGNATGSHTYTFPTSGAASMTVHYTCAAAGTGTITASITGASSGPVSYEFATSGTPLT